MGYGLDLRTMPAELVHERGLAIIANGDEVVNLPVGRTLVYAVVTACTFADPAGHKVARDWAAFLALTVCFRVVEALPGPAAASPSDASHPSDP